MRFCSRAGGCTVYIRQGRKKDQIFSAGVQEAWRWCTDPQCTTFLVSRRPQPSLDGRTAISAIIFFISIVIIAITITIIISIIGIICITIKFGWSDSHQQRHHIHHLNNIFITIVHRLNIRSDVKTGQSPRLDEEGMNEVNSLCNSYA